MNRSRRLSGGMSSVVLPGFVRMLAKSAWTSGVARISLWTSVLPAFARSWRTQPDCSGLLGTLHLIGYLPRDVLALTRRATLKWAPWRYCRRQAHFVFCLRDACPRIQLPPLQALGGAPAKSSLQPQTVNPCLRFLADTLLQRGQHIGEAGGNGAD